MTSQRANTLRGWSTQQAYAEFWCRNLWKTDSWKTNRRRQDNRPRWWDSGSGQGSLESNSVGVYTTVMSLMAGGPNKQRTNHSQCSALLAPVLQSGFEAVARAPRQAMRDDWLLRTSDTCRNGHSTGETQGNPQTRLLLCVIPSISHDTLPTAVYPTACMSSSMNKKFPAVMDIEGSTPST